MRAERQESGVRVMGLGHMTIIPLTEHLHLYKIEYCRLGRQNETLCRIRAWVWTEEG